MITAQEVREKAKGFTKIQEQEQLKREEEQLEKIEKEILETIENDTEITTLIVVDLYQNNLKKLEELGFSCEMEDDEFFNCYHYHISWGKLN